MDFWILYQIRKLIEVSDRVRHYFYIDSNDDKRDKVEKSLKINHGKMW